MSAEKQISKQPTSWVQAAQVEIIAGVFFILGIAAFAFLFLIISTNPYITGSDSSEPFAWRFIQSVGIIRPLLILAASVLLFSLGLRLRTHDIGAARWARLVLIWLLVIVGVVIVYSIITKSNTMSLDQILIPLLPVIVVELLLVLVYLLVQWSMPLFKGDEHIHAQTTRKAWNLLVPTLLIFFAIAISPLEQVFVRSLTNEKFASSETINYIGFDNYSELLGLRVDTIPCELADDGSCLQVPVEDGSGKTEIAYPSLRDHLGDDYREVRRNYRDVATFDFLGNRYVLSARDSQFFDAIVTSIVYTFFAIFLQLTIGMFMALVLASRLRGITLMRLAMLVPMAIPTLIATQFWDVMLHPDKTGLINSFLLDLGLIAEPQSWLLTSYLQVPALILVIVWKETPTFALLILPGLLGISPEIYQAASIDGANKFQQFFRITLPMLRPVIGVALILRTMVTLRVFDVFEIMVDPPRFSMATYAYQNLIQEQKLGYASAISVVIFFIALIFTIFYMRSLRIDEA